MVATCSALAEAAAGARSPHQHPRRLQQPERSKRSVRDRDGEGRHRRDADANTMAGNPNMIRPNKQHVIIDAPDPTETVFSDEFNGDVSTIAAQGTVTYTYASQLPFSNIPRNAASESWVMPPAPQFPAPVSSTTPTRRVKSWLPSRRSSPGCSRRRTRVSTSCRSPMALGSAGCQRRPDRTDERRHGAGWGCRCRERGRQRLVRHGRGACR